MATLPTYFSVSLSPFFCLGSKILSPFCIRKSILNYRLKMLIHTVFEQNGLNSSKIHIKDRNKVENILNTMIRDGRSKLQVISDFDRTITKQHEDNKKYFSSFALFAHCKSIPQSYLENDIALMKKYVPIETDPNIPHNEKLEHMKKWWSLSETSVKGLSVQPEEIYAVVAELGPSLRDGTYELFRDLCAAGIPVLVFSAGLGDCVVAVLKHFNVLLDNVKVVSNFLKYEYGVVQGFIDKTIHLFNKNEDALRGTDYFHTIEGRGNVILLGDSLGDVTMAEGVPHLNVVLKIGFLYDHIEDSLPLYMDSYDIVLEDDQTMDVVRTLLKQIL